MSDFFKKFLLEDPRRLSPNGRYVALAAFGKHPGWDDHVEPRDSREAKGLGLETESLNVAKTVLYVKGIGGQIDSGAWEKLDSAQQLPTFKHIFVWQRSGQILVGRLWSSSDGKGRTRYPMVACLHFVGVPLGWALKQALPALRELEEACSTTTSAGDVCSLLGRKRAALRDAVQSTEGRGEYAPLAPHVLHSILQPFSGPKFEGFLRALYQVQSQFGTFLTGKFKANSTTFTSRAQQIRVPAAGENPEEALLFWTRFFLAQLDPSVPLLLILPLEEGWVDVTVGEPESREFFCLRASPKAVPMVSEVPYNLDETFRAKATVFLEDLSGAKSSVLIPAAAPALEARPPTKSGWRKWLGGAVVMMIASAAVFVLPKVMKQRETVSIDKGDSVTPTVKTEVVAQPMANNAASEVVVAKAGLDARAEATRLAEERSRSNAALAAAKLKAEAEAVSKEREHQAAEVARLKKEPAVPAPTIQQQEKPSAVALTEKKTEEPALIPKAPEPTASVASSTSHRAEMTNGIGMILVQLPSGLWAGKYEVTQAEYRKVMGTNTSQPANDRRPVDRVAWSDAKEFCRKLTEMEKGSLPAGKVYSLPTTKQWEELVVGQTFAELPGAGVTGRWWPANVGQSGPANKHGLFDVLGNVWEWCLDGGHGEEKVMKGGAFNSTDYERKWFPGKPVSNCGFRCVLAAP